MFCSEGVPNVTNCLMIHMLIGYARCSTDKQDLAAQVAILTDLGVAADRIYTDHGFTGTNRARPGLDQALAALRQGDTLVVPKLDRLARSVPDARAIAENLASRDLERRLGELAARDQSEELIVELIPAGSGWGALENELRAHTGQNPLPAEFTPFPTDAVGNDEQFWARLLRGESATDDELDPSGCPRSYQIDPRWVPLLEQRSDWLALLHLGVIAAAAGSYAEAEKLWLASVDSTPNAWALRNLGALADDRGNRDEAVAFYRAAHALAPELLPLTRELLSVLARAGLAAEVLDLIDGLDGDARNDGRVLVAEARASLATGDVERCRSILDRDLILVDLREGDSLLEDLWNEYSTAAGSTGEPLPQKYDFRM